ncbi:hypothetical protein B5E41_29735 [Rhizobium esperanzae]|uniref:Solute-binding protein family 3/N-terminal domain-containing protein n=1 Tax=Rhizobium esperanzae TaxID=1967781 RepID=A0A246DKZ6_9HYPH|nr:transporter substrate-binding domain-containing protein [Rhizobium esperanzae]OWO89817.1 hypothetical protein B5E41_29735 [Rhizobium esperanzae]
MKPNNYRLVVSAVTAASCLFALNVWAGGEEVVLKAATITYYPPFSYKDEKTNELAGFDHDLAEAIAAKMGAKIEWAEFTYAQLLSLAPLKTGRVDFYGTAVTDRKDRREGGLNFVDYVYEPFVFFTLRENANKYGDPMQLCGESVATTRGDPTQADRVKTWSDANCVKNGKAAINVAFGENSANNLLLLKQGRVAGAVNGAGTLAVANQKDSNKYLVVGQPLSRNMYGMGFLSENTELGEKLKDALQTLIEEGTYDRLLEKWNLPESSHIGKAEINAGVQ